jgi:hypothetical protein
LMTIFWMISVSAVHKLKPRQPSLSGKSDVRRDLESRH